MDPEVDFDALCRLFIELGPLLRLLPRNIVCLACVAHKAVDMEARLTKDLSALGAKTYDDADIADFCDGLDHVDTYQLAFRDLPDIIARHVTGPAALDFAC